VGPEQYLLAKGFKLRKAPGEHQTQCPFCNDKNKYGHLYVNREHGAYMCHRCGEKGSFYDLQVNLGDTPEPMTRDLAHRWDVWSHAVGLFQDAILNAPEVLRYLKQERGLSAETVGKYRLGWAPRDFMDQMLIKWTIADLKRAGLVNEEGYPLFWDRIMIPYYQRDHVVTLRGKQVGSNVIQAKDTSIQLFGADNLRGHAEVYVCEGEFDAMYLNQLGYAACAIPGALSYQEHWNA
jgi:DNA primase